MSPASGTSFNPIISTGVEGPAFFTLFPELSNIALILPLLLPVTMISPCFSVPVWTNRVAIAPLLLSILASTTTPFASLLGLALYSLISETSWIPSNSCSTPSPVRPDRGTAITSPPQSSINRLFSESCL